jgi:hypothetical protein
MYTLIECSKFLLDVYLIIYCDIIYCNIHFTFTARFRVAIHSLRRSAKRRLRRGRPRAEMDLLTE